MSFDDGANWQSLRLNLPDTPVHDIVVEERDLVIAHARPRLLHHGQHRAAAAVAALQTTSNLHLFKPDDALRGLDRIAGRRLLPEAAGARRSRSSSSTARARSIRTLHRHDGRRRQAAGAAGGGRLLPPAAGSASAGGGGPAPADWDMRYAGATDFPGLIMWAASTRGPQCAARNVPGARDRRRPDRDAVVRHQARAAPARGRHRRRICRSSSTSRCRSAIRRQQANDAVLLVRGIKPQITDRQSKLDPQADGRPTKTLEDLEQEPDASRGADLSGEELQSSQDPLNFPIKLNNKIAALQGIVESADVKPTEQTYSMFRTLSNRLDEQLQKLDATVTARCRP